MKKPFRAYLPPVFLAIMKMNSSAPNKGRNYSPYLRARLVL